MARSRRPKARNRLLVIIRVSRIILPPWGGQRPVLHRRLCGSQPRGIRRGPLRASKSGRWNRSQGGGDELAFPAENGDLLLIFEEKILKIRTWYFPQGSQDPRPMS